MLSAAEGKKAHAAPADGGLLGMGIGQPLLLVWVLLLLLFYSQVSLSWNCVCNADTYGCHVVLVTVACSAEHKATESDSSDAAREVRLRAFDSRSTIFCFRHGHGSTGKTCNRFTMIHNPAEQRVHCIGTLYIANLFTSSKQGLVCVIIYFVH